MQRGESELQAVEGGWPRKETKRSMLKPTYKPAKRAVALKLPRRGAGTVVSSSLSDLDHLNQSVRVHVCVGVPWDE